MNVFLKYMYMMSSREFLTLIFRGHSHQSIQSPEEKEYFDAEMECEADRCIFRVAVHYQATTGSCVKETRRGRGGWQEVS